MGKILRKALERRNARRNDMASTHERLSRNINYKGDAVKAYKMPGSMKG